MLPRIIKATVTIKGGLALARPVRGGKHDGKIVIENIRPKLTGGSRKIVDETFKDTAKFKNTVDGEITE